MLYSIAKELLALYSDNTESDYRQNSLNGNPDALVARQIYRCCSESAWYLIQGLVTCGKWWWSMMMMIRWRLASSRIGGFVIAVEDAVPEHQHYVPLDSIRSP